MVCFQYSFHISCGGWGSTRRVLGLLGTCLNSTDSLAGASPVLVPCPGMDSFKGLSAMGFAAILYAFFFFSLYIFFLLIIIKRLLCAKDLLFSLFCLSIFPNIQSFMISRYKLVATPLLKITQLPTYKVSN